MQGVLEEESNFVIMLNVKAEHPFEIFKIEGCRCWDDELEFAEDAWKLDFQNAFDNHIDALMMCSKLEKELEKNGKN